MIKVKVKDSSSKTDIFLRRMKAKEQFAHLEKYGRIGADALASATPQDSGLTSGSWTYTIVQRSGYYSIVWRNTDVEGDVPVAVLIQYGHATGNGGYVHGQDFINPAIRPIFDQILADMWKVVTK